LPEIKYCLNLNSFYFKLVTRSSSGAKKWVNPYGQKKLLVAASGRPGCSIGAE
jgi:hypothetical protein